MDIPASEIYGILINKDVKGLYHANTVRTSKTFLEQGGILSRKRIEDLGLVQTPQKSNEIDKKYIIWNDIFFDAINVSKYFSNYNKYGPILFLFSLDLLKSEKLILLELQVKIQFIGKIPTEQKIDILFLQKIFVQSLNQATN